jgi:drug/metabolite transporter (DMT)-like permease
MEKSETPNDLENAKLVIENNENPLYIVKSEHYTQMDCRCETSLAKLRNYRGLFYAALSALFSSLTHIILRRCVYFHGSDQALVRYIIQFAVVSIFYYFYNRQSKLKEEENDKLIRTSRKLLITRGLFGAIGILSVAFSIKLINPSDTIAILNCKVILISICSRIFLREKHTIIHLVSLSLTILGVLFISQPKFLTNLLQHELNSTLKSTTVNFSRYIIPQTQILGVGLAFVASVSVTIIYLMIKKLCEKDIHVSVIMLYASYFGVPATLTVSLFMHIFSYEQYKAGLRFETSELIFQAGLTILTGFLELASQLCTNVALKHEDASKIALIKSSELFLTNIFQYLFLDIVANLFSKIGGLLIFSSMCMVLLHKIFDKKFNSEKKTQTECRVKNQSLFQKVMFFKF